MHHDVIYYHNARGAVIFWGFCLYLPSSLFNERETIVLFSWSVLNPESFIMLDQKRNIVKLKAPPYAESDYFIYNISHYIVLMAVLSCPLCSAWLLSAVCFVLMCSYKILEKQRLCIATMLFWHGSLHAEPMQKGRRTLPLVIICFNIII